MAARTDSGINRASGAAKRTIARRVSAWIIPATGVLAPERMLVAVRAIAPVAGSPPNSGERMLATPWPKDLLNSRMAYVSVSRGRYDAQIYTDNVATLGQKLSRDVSHSPAIQQEPVAQKIEPQPARTNEVVQDFGLGL
jgi:hypothetical protein